ncbi:hypothetical protein V1512DRAFT_257082 [Lipomyces arxii]|uniref:uncharacterized protein n=1 Tax=Lipomyces arxii TaxID=56418 RepID=UPI0034CFBDEE
MIAADDLVAFVVEQIALEGIQGCTVSRLWEIVATKVTDLDANLKTVVWNWLLLQNKQISVNIKESDDDLRELTSADNDRADLSLLLSKYGDSLRICATEEWLWFSLTGSSKEESMIGPMPFKLLCVITRTREHGINVVDLARIAKQDPRSMTSRVKVLVDAGLVKKISVVLKKYGNTSLIISLKFFREVPVLDPSEGVAIIDYNKIRHRIMDLLKRSKNGIRQRHDLRKELGQFNTKEKIKLFARMIRSLEDKGCARRVSVVKTSDSTARKHPCIQYVKDLDDTKEDEVDAQDYDEDNDLDVLSEDDDGGVGNDTFDLSAGDNFQVQADTSDVLGPSFNRFFPIENQIYDIVSSTGDSGVSSMDLTRQCVGVDYKRMFYTILFKFGDASGSDGSKTPQPPHLAQYAIVRNVDSMARLNYYRYFTLPHYRTITDKPHDDIWGEFSPLSSKNKTISNFTELSKHLNRNRIATDIDIGIDAHGNRVPAWRGVSANLTKISPIKSSSTPGPPADSDSKKRRRPRKGAAPQVADNTTTQFSTNVIEPSVPASDLIIDAEGSIDSHDAAVDKSVLEQQSAGSQHDRPTSIQKLFEIVVPKIPANKPTVPKDNKLKKRSIFSIAASQRQNAILKLLDESQGVMEGGKKLADAIKNIIGDSLSGLLDNRTVKRDLDTLMKQNKIRKLCITASDKQGLPLTIFLLTYPHLTVESAEVAQYTEQLISERSEAKKMKKLEVIADDFSFYIMPAQSKAQRLRIERMAEKSMQVAKLSTSQQQAASDRLRRRVADDNTNTKGLSLVTIGKKARLPRVSPKSMQSSLPLQPAELLSDTTTAKNTLSISESQLAASATLKRKRSRKAFPANSSDNPLAKFAPRGKKPKTTTSTSSKKKRADTLREQKESFRQARSLISLGNKQIDDIFRVVIITRSFYGGSSNNIDWDRVSAALGEHYTVAVVHSVWPKVRKVFGGTKGVASGADRWERIFLEGYEAEKFPAFDLKTVDIYKMAQYWRENDGDVVKHNDSGKFFANHLRDRLLQGHEFVRDEPAHNWLDNVLMAVSSVKSEETLVSVPFAVNQDSMNPASIFASSPLDSTKQLIKAIVAAEEAEHQPEAAKALLDKFGIQLCAQAVKEMEKARSLVYMSGDLESRLPGRNFAFSDRFNFALRLRTKEASFSKACFFRDRLKNAFSESKGIIMSRLAPDSSMICLLDLVAKEQIELVRVNVSAGKLMDGYTSRLVDREKLDCDIVLKSNAEHELPPLPSQDVAFPGVRDYEHPERFVPGSRLWVNVTGEFNHAWFLKVVNAVLLTISLRPGISPFELCRKFSIALTPVEMRDVLNWIVGKELVMYDERRGDGYWVKDGWYCSETTSQ